jgi:hypothetical protein
LIRAELRKRDGRPKGKKQLKEQRSKLREIKLEVRRMKGF